MTLVRSEQGQSLFYAEPPPQTGKVEDVARWAEQQFSLLFTFLRTPELAAATFTPQSAIDSDKLTDGMLVYAAAGLLGVAEGFYMRELGTWVKV